MKRRADTPKEAEFRAEARAWLEANAKRRTGVNDWSVMSAEHSPETERIHFDRTREWQAKLYDGGWAAITWPSEYGGRDGSAVESLIWGEEVAEFDVTSGFLGASISMIGPSLIRFGTDAQKERFLKPLLRGDEVWCQLFSEPEAGSDLAAVRTRAVLDGDEFVISGQKVWTTSSHLSDWGFMLARTNVDVPKHDGISFLLVDMKVPGIDPRPLVTMRGDTHFSEVFFNDARTAKENILNGLDRGWDVAKYVMMHEGQHIGTASNRGTQTAGLVRTAVEVGRFEDSSIRQKLAEVYVEERVLGLLQERLRAAVLDGRRPDVDGSVLKILWGEGGHRKALFANELQGAHAMLAGSSAPAAGLWQDQMLSRSSGTVGGGTSEVHRNGLGERALGLPREPRLDRDQLFRDLKISGG